MRYNEENVKKALNDPSIKPFLFHAQNMIIDQYRLYSKIGCTVDSGLVYLLRQNEDNYLKVSRDKQKEKQRALKEEKAKQNHGVISSLIRQALN